MEYPISIATDAIDPRDNTFDANETPILDFHEKRLPQPGWNLSYMESDGNGVEDCWIGGEFKDLEWALAKAQEHLNLIHYVWPRT